MIIMVLVADQGGRWREEQGEETEGSFSHVEVELMVASPEDIQEIFVWTEGDRTGVIRQRYESPVQNQELTISLQKRLLPGKA